MPTIEVLGFEGCPHFKPTLRRVRETAAALRVAVEVRSVLLKPEDDLARLRFLGSPTVLVNQLDIEPAARARSDYAYTCRVYGNSGTPPTSMIEAALHAVIRQA